MFKKLFCAWCAIANSTLLNIEWPDGNSQYYGTILNSSNFKIKGYYPKSRYFSFELYSTDTWEPFWSIYDKQIQTSNNPYKYNIDYTDNLSYSLQINANYSANFILLYRIYMGIDLYGGVQLPILEVNSNELTECNQSSRPIIDIQDSDPDYELYKQNENNNFYPPVTKKKLFINADARYMIAFYNKSSFNYAKIKLKMPTIPKNMSSKMYQTRYFSLSTVDLSEPKQTIQTLSDKDFLSDTNYLTLYVYCISNKDLVIHLTPPANSSKNCLNIFGILYRQLLPQFKHEIPNNRLSQNNLMKVMGDYYPLVEWN